MDCDANNPEHNERDRKWSIFIIASGVIYGVGLIGILIGYYLKSLIIRKKKQANIKDTKKGWYLRIKESAAKIENGKSLPGKILVSSAFGASGRFRILYSDIMRKESNVLFTHFT